jgi:hypothetical protein
MWAMQNLPEPVVARRISPTGAVSTAADFTRPWVAGKPAGRTRLKTRGRAARAGWSLRVPCLCAHF